MARVHNHRVGARLRQEEGLSRERVGKNGFIAESHRTTLGTCPYPLRLFACRQWWGTERPERCSALPVTPDLEATNWPARRVGVFYNERQIIEAGIKESKGHPHAGTRPAVISRRGEDRPVSGIGPPGLDDCWPSPAGP